MPLRLTRAATLDALWHACASSFLDETSGGGSGNPWPAHLWLTHRNQRDALFELARKRGIPGWLDPPISFFSQLREDFGIEERPVGLLTARLLVARLARSHGRRLALDPATAERGPARAGVLDAVFSELLPEGVTPERLREALDALPADEFGGRRNAWVADTYEAFLRELAAEDRYDPRAIHARLGDRIESGGLSSAIGGAARLHVYGITSLRGRRRLFERLAAQPEVDVMVYALASDEPDDFEALGLLEAPAAARESGNGASPAALPSPDVQPAPDPVREADWIAREVKKLIAVADVEPHRIAIVARSGRQDTRIAYRSLEAVGVPATARLRTPLSEIPCLRSLLALFGAEAKGWAYLALRQVLTSPYTGSEVDIRAFDYLAGRRRIEGLQAWSDALVRCREALDSPDRGRLAGAGVYQDALDRDIEAFERLRTIVGELSKPRTEREWIQLTLHILGGGWFDFRRRLCRPVAERWDVVRIDQRGVQSLEALLRDWHDWLERVSPGEPFHAEEWHLRLRRLLEANELTLSTPLQAGVQILEAHEAALTPFDRTFVMHANDGIFPRTPARSGVFTDAERVRLRALGLPLATRDETLRRERALWRSVTTSAGVTVSYRTTDAEGVPRLPSLMVPAHDRGTEIPRSRKLDGRRDEAAVSPADRRALDVRRIARLRRGGDESAFPTPDPERIRHAILGAFGDELRSGLLDRAFPTESDLIESSSVEAGEVPHAPLDPAAVLGIERPLSQLPSAWNGKLRDPAVLASLGDRYTDDYRWSASQLQKYGVRPFDFFLDRVLRLSAHEEAEEETSPLAFGSVAHDILERFYARVLDRLPDELDEEALSIYVQVTNEVFRDHEADLERWLGLPRMWSVTREKVRRQVAEFLDRDLRQTAKMGDTPLFVELSFGGEDQPEMRIDGHDRSGSRATLRLRGRIDRIDRLRNGGLRVIDYKSGRVPTPRGYEDGSLFQTALYMKAAELLGHGETAEGAFRSIRQQTRNGARLGRDRLEDVLKFAHSIPARVRGGMFEPVQASTSRIADWQPGLEVTRTEATIEAGSRFDIVRGRIRRSEPAMPDGGDGSGG